MQKDGKTHKAVETSVPVELIRRYFLYPRHETEDCIYIQAFETPGTEIINELQFLTGKKIVIESADYDTVIHGIEDTCGFNEKLSDIVPSETVKNKGSIAAEPQKQNPVISSTSIKVLDYILTTAIQKRASDIHFELYEKEVILRFRIDGVLLRQESVPDNLYHTIITRIKILSELNIGERRLPQDGKISFVSNGLEYDLRVSIMPAFFAESCVIRILKRNKDLLTLNELGFFQNDIDIIKRAASSSNGLILINSPTGSGKTTTLFSILNLIDCGTRKVITIEDPIEYFFNGATQIQVKPEIGFDFARGLRSILRHDPDVLLVGEIRDGETAEIALRAALTGHLVFSTIHTTDNAATILRLIDLGVDRHLIAQSLRLLLSQCLVRTLCTECRVKTSEGYTPKGCRICGFTGYYGRTAEYSIVEATEEVRSIIERDEVDRAEIRRVLGRILA